MFRDSLGLAFASIDHSGVLIFAAHFPLPGDVQTVSRGEFLALMALIPRGEQFADIEFVTDNKGVNDKYNAGPKVASQSMNCDLYHELFQLLYKKAIKPHVR